MNETNFSYRNTNYLSFLEFMVDYSIFNNSTKCIKLLKNLISDDMKIKRHKRKPIISFNT